jgi:hypothetical protein
MIKTGENHDHDHEDSHDEIQEDLNVPEPTEANIVNDTVERHVHDHDGLEGLWEVMFGFEHVVAEFFWNGVFILATFLFTKAIALRKIHKYVDDKHDIKHDKY